MGKVGNPLIEEPLILRREVEVHIHMRGDGIAIERCGLEVPSAQGGFDLLIDPVADGLHNLGLYDIPLRVNGHNDHDIADQIAWKLGARYRRIRVHNRIRDMNFMSSNRPVNHSAER